MGGDDNVVQFVLVLVAAGIMVVKRSLGRPQSPAYIALRLSVCERVMVTVTHHMAGVIVSVTPPPPASPRLAHASCPFFLLEKAPRQVFQLLWHHLV